MYFDSLLTTSSSPSALAEFSSSSYFPVAIHAIKQQIFLKNGSPGCKHEPPINSLTFNSSRVFPETTHLQQPLRKNQKKHNRTKQTKQVLLECNHLALEIGKHNFAGKTFGPHPLPFMYCDHSHGPGSPDLNMSNLSNGVHFLW